MSLITDIKPFVAQVITADKLKRCLLYAVLPALIFYTLGLIGLRTLGYETMEILRDPAQQTKTSSFLGFLSSVGVWFWVSAAAISFFTILTGGGVLTRDHKSVLFLAGTLSLLLAIDDYFLIHDRYINQNICYLTYGVFALALLFRHYETILKIDGLAFVLAGVLLAGSIFTDLVQSFIPIHYSYVQIVEEGFKFTGGAVWLYFIARAAAYCWAYRPAPEPRAAGK